MPADFIDPAALCVGMFVELELGWMAHPFPTGSFRISSDKQIAIIRGLGLQQVRIRPERGDPPTAVDRGVPPAQSPSDALLLTSTGGARPGLVAREARLELIGAQQRGLAQCERRFGDAIRLYRQVLEQVGSKPRSAREQAVQLVDGLVGELLGQGESAIRLLSEGMGDKSAMHPINVAVLSLLLGRSMGLAQAELTELGLAAFFHDLGKTQLPDRVRLLEDSFTGAEHSLYQEHVALGVALGRRMDLPSGVLQAMAQHHELADGSGFPARLRGAQIAPAARILALVNCYENLCNPGRPAAALTPHEALSLLFAQMKAGFDASTLDAFIRMMGVYPPGSVVQLVDERYAVVVSVNSARPLRPRLIVHESGVDKGEALVLDLEQAPALGIRRSIKPASLPRAAMDYLSPRQRICYFFERAIEPGQQRTVA